MITVAFDCQIFSASLTLYASWDFDWRDDCFAMESSVTEWMLVKVSRGHRWRRSMNVATRNGRRYSLHRTVDILDCPFTPWQKLRRLKRYAYPSTPRQSFLLLIANFYGAPRKHQVREIASFCLREMPDLEVVILHRNEISNKYLSNKYRSSTVNSAVYFFIRCTYAL